MRSHLFEIHDQEWCPEFLRNELTLTLKNGWSLPLPQVFEDWFGFKSPFQVAGDVLMNTLTRMNGYQKQMTVVDICSGSGGPVPSITEYIKTGYRTRVNYILTDLFPNLDQLKTLKNDLITYENVPIDAGNVPKHLSTYFRTSFGSFHHLPAPIARNVFTDVIKNKSGIAVFELTGRNLFSIFAIGFGVPILGFFFYAFF
jgi:hypothetical protein